MRLPKWIGVLWIITVLALTVTTFGRIALDIRDHYANQRYAQACKDKGGTLVKGYDGPACFVGVKTGHL